MKWLPLPLTRDVITVSQRLVDAEERLRCAPAPPGAEDVCRTGHSITLRVVAPRWRRIPFRPTLVRITLAGSEHGTTVVLLCRATVAEVVFLTVWVTGFMMLLSHGGQSVWPAVAMASGYYAVGMLVGFSPARVLIKEWVEAVIT